MHMAEDEWTSLAKWIHLWFEWRVGSVVYVIRLFACIFNTLHNCTVYHLDISTIKKDLSFRTLCTFNVSD